MASSSSLSDASAARPTLAFVSTGCNRDPNAISWLASTTAEHPQGLLAYAADSLVAIYDPAAQVVIATLRGHIAKVNAVQWIKGDDSTAAAANGTRELVSAGVDKQVIVWRFNPTTRDYTIEGRLVGHTDGVSAVSALRVGSYSLIASTACDLTVRIWMRANVASPLVVDDAPPPAEAGGWQCIQVLSNGRHKIMHALDLTAVPLPASDDPTVPSSLLALSVGGVDCKIHVWLSDGSSPSSVEFANAVSLAGHENWIRSLEWTQMDRETAVMQSVGNEKESLTAPLVSLMLASASQDKRIRLWKLQVGRNESADAASATSGAISCTSLGSRGHILSYRGFSLLLVLESVLGAHDNWVMSARWQPAVSRTVDGVTTRHQPMRLLSASTDKSMAVWSPATDGIWCTEAKVGEMGGHTLGFYGCAFSPTGDAILANGYSGSFHLWRMSDAATRSGVQWTPAVMVSGHSASVNDLCWDAQGDYLLSTSTDQSTRLWAPWQDHRVPTPAIHDATTTAIPAASASASSTIPLRASWHEISRPQLHGYDLNCITPMYDPTHVRAHSLASGADEKVVRVFWAPQPFLDTVKRIAGVETIEASNATAERPLLAPLVDESRTLEGGNGGGEDEEGEEMKLPSPSPVASKGNAEQLAFLEASSSRAVKASLPELGLSNKALMDGDSASTLRGVMQHVQQLATGAQQLSVGAPPPEDYLLTTTLWPEVEKLYGHGYEIISIACNHAGTLLASACVAKKSTHAVVRVWETSDWSEVLQLESHRSSVISLAFSPDDRYLLSASKDRHVTVFELRVGVSGVNKSTLLGSAKCRAHARIVWSASWAPIIASGAHYFATGSRDKTVRCFRVTGEVGRPSIVDDATLPAFPCAVTAVAFAPLAPRHESSAPLFPAAQSPRPLTLAVGLEDGRIELWQSATPLVPDSQDKLQWSRLYAFPPNVCHGGFVKRLAWRWRAASDVSDLTSELELASCSEDQSVRIFAVPAALLLRV